MTHSKSGKIKILVFGLLLILFGIAVNYYVIRNFIIWGPEKGRLAVFLWMMLSVSFTLMLLLDKFKILILYAISIPFLLRLNITNFIFGFYSIKIHPFVLSEIILIFLLVFKIITEKRGEFTGKTSLSEFLIWYSLILTFAASIVSAMLSSYLVLGDTLIPYFSTIGQTIIPGILMILIYHSIDTRNQIMQLLKVLYIAFILNIFIGSIAFFSNISAVELFLKRMAFNFYGPNIYAAVVQLFIPLGLLFIIESNGKERTLYYLLFFLTFISLILTLSRGGIIAAIIGLIAIYFIHNDYKLPLKRISIVLSIFLIGISGAVYNLIMRFSGIMTRSRITEFSTLIRTAAWETAIKAIIRYPLGIGGNQFPYVWSDMGRFPSQTVLHPHNFMLGMALEYGIITAAAFIIMAAVIMQKLYIIAKKNITNINRRLASVLFVSIGTYLIMGIVSEGPRCHLRQNGELYNDGLVFLFLFLGIAVRLIIIVKNEQKKNTPDCSS